MAYDGKLLARARAELDNIRRKNQEEQKARQGRVYTLLPRIEEIDRTLRGHMAQIVRLTISKAPDIAEKIAAIREENLSLQMERAELLTQRGFGAEYLDEIVACPKCRDTGIFEGEVCTCLDKLYNKELTRELGTLMRRGDESFESFDLGKYPEGYEREQMSKVLGVCRNYAENFANASANMLFFGGTGLGKTFLSACVARTVAAQGFSVCYETASAALDYYERAKFSRDMAESEEASVRVKRMESCDLMILDDLGTEMITPMSQSALYSLVNNRLVNGKKTIISTNCNEEELARKYIPQISSRILGNYRKMPFLGEDIRLKK